MKKTLALILISIMMCVPAALAAPAAAPVAPASSAPAAGGSSDLSKMSLEEKKQFYNLENLRTLKEIPNGFSLNDFFDYNDKATEFVLDGPPKLILKKGQYGDTDTFKTNQFKLTAVGDASIESIRAGEQEFKDIPKGSTVEWNGKRLKLTLPNKKTLEFSEQEKGGGGTAKITKIPGNPDEYMIYGEFNQAATFGDALIEGNVNIFTGDGLIKGRKGTIVRDPRFGTFKFLSDGGSLELSDTRARLTGEFHFTTKENRDLKTSGDWEYDANTQIFKNNNKEGSITDRDSGVTGKAKNDVPFQFGLNEGTQLTGDGIVVGKLFIPSAAGSEPGKLSDKQIKDTKQAVLNAVLAAKSIELVGLSMMATANVEKDIRAYFKDTGEIGLSENLRTTLSGVADGTSWGSSALTEWQKKDIRKLLDNLPSFDRAISSGDPREIKSVILSIKTQAIRDLKEEFKDNPSVLNQRTAQATALSDRITGIIPTPQPSQVKTQAPFFTVRVFGDVEGTFLNRDDKEVTFRYINDKFEVDSNGATSKYQSLKFVTESGKEFTQQGAGLQNNNERLTMASLPRNTRAQQSAAAAATPAPAALSEDDKKAFEWNRARYDTYGRKAQGLVSEHSELSQFNGIFGADSKPDVQKIKEMQEKLNEGREDKLKVDGKLGQLTLDAMNDKVAWKGYKANPDEPYDAQQKMDSMAKKAVSKSSLDQALDMQVRRANEQFEAGKITEDQYDDMLDTLEERFPGLRIDEGEVQSYPTRKASHSDVTASAAGEKEKVRLADLLLTNPRLSAEVDGDLAKARAALEHPESASLADAIDSSKRLERALGSSRSAAAAALGSSDYQPVTKGDVAAFKDFVEKASSEEFAQQWEETGTEAERAAFMRENGNALKGLISAKDKLSSIQKKIDSGVALSQEEVQMMSLVKDPRILDAVNNIKPVVEAIQPGTSGNLDKLSSANKKLQVIDVQAFSKSNPFGVGMASSTLRSMGLDSSAIPSSMTVRDGIYAGNLLNSRYDSTSSAGLIPLIHLGLEKGNTVVIASKDGIGAVAATLSGDGRTVSFSDVRDTSAYARYDRITLDLAAVAPAGSARNIASIPSEQLRNQLIRGILSAAGNHPLDAADILSPSSGADSSALRDTPPTTPVKMDMASLYNQGALDITGIKYQGLRMKLGAMNEITASKALMPENLKLLADKYNGNADAVLAEIHRKYTKRTGTDTAVRAFVNQYWSSKGR